MDSKRLEECIKALSMEKWEYITRDIRKDILDLAIKVKEGKLVEPMSEEELKYAIFAHADYLKCKDVDSLASKLVGKVGKLSTPRLTDWEKVLPEKVEQHGDGVYSFRWVNGYNQAIDDCLSALKSIGEPRLMEECPYLEDVIQQYCCHPYSKCPIYKLETPHTLAQAISKWVEGRLPKEGVWETTKENKHRGEGLTMGWNMCLAQVRKALLGEEER